MLLVLVESGQDGAAAPGTADLVAFARGLSDPVHAVVFGDGAADLGAFGIDRVYRIRHELLTDYGPELHGQSLAQLIAGTRPDAVLAAAGERASEVMAHAAARAGLPLATNCVAVERGDPWTLTRVRGGGMLLEDAELSASTALITVAQEAAVPPGDPVPVARVEVEDVVPELDPELARTRVVERVAGGTRISLATAPVVVAGGRGVGSAEGYAELEELAELLGGVVGCSRVATNNGWRPHSDQVGLTGTQVAPDLYIACGISGATQHWVGCMNARTILAINTDPEAPMVTRSTYAVLGDLHDVLPAIIDELRARQPAAPVLHHAEA